MVLNPCWCLTAAVASGNMESWSSTHAECIVLLLQVVIWSHGPQPMLVDAAAVASGNMESWSSTHAGV